MTEEKCMIMRFDAKVRDIDRQYEINNNGELDNGVYNKFVNNSIRNDEEGENAEEEMVSNPTDFSGYVGYIEDFNSSSASKFDY